MTLERTQTVPATLNRKLVKFMLETCGITHTKVTALLTNPKMPYQQARRLVKRMISTGLLEIYDPTTGQTIEQYHDDRLSRNMFIRRTRAGDLAHIEFTHPQPDYVPVRLTTARMKYGAYLINPNTKSTKERTASIKSAVTRPTQLADLRSALGMSALSVLRYASFMLHYGMITVVENGVAVPFDESMPITEKTVVQAVDITA